MLPLKYEYNKLKNKEKILKELLRFFALEVTAYSAVDILDIPPNSVACSTIKSDDHQPSFTLGCR